MIFKSLTLEDFGSYKGIQTLFLSPSDQGNIVLVGGTNGAGKTTLLEAFTLCLHGRRALGPRVGQPEYEEHMASRFHITPGGPAKPACGISLLFEVVQAGVAREIKVSRTWTQNASGAVREDLTIDQDGQTVDELDETGRQEFLDHLMPPALTDFFLFDGEQIQRLADDENGELLGGAVRRLMGLDVIEQLQKDLRRFAKKTANVEGNELSARVLEAGLVLDRASNVVSQLHGERAELHSRRDQLLARSSRARDRLTQEGGSFVSRRSEIETEASAAAKEVVLSEERLRSQIAGLLPFAITQRLVVQTEKRLTLEHVAEEDSVVRERLSRVEAEAREFTFNQQK